ncbi:MAG: flagellar motor stator protein MotA [Alphaproteobacteria bacterium]|nr:MAG: flagellar motor stator protein MotA [Alphaproteobacteria bacterium]
MFKIIGFLGIFGATFGGLIMTAGLEKAMHLLTGVILPAMPGETVIIMGCAIFAFIIANSGPAIKHTLKYCKLMMNPAAHSKEEYIELLSFLFVIFKMAKTKGWLALEQHIENPHDSDIFKAFPSIIENHHTEVFLCDYFRIISLGNDNPHEIEALMDEEIETIQHHEEHPSHAIQGMADGIPALGIVAAVLGVIKTMASISEPPEVLGKLIGGALVGTFLGVWFAYGFFGPMALAMGARAASEIKYYKVMKVCIMAFLQGCAPQVSVEFGRKILDHDVQPTFLEVEEATNNVPTF